MIKKFPKACICLCLLALGSLIHAQEALDSQQAQDSQQALDSQQVQDNQQALDSQQVQDSSYVLRANDTISMNVYGEPDLSGTVKILKTGHVSFPLIGSFIISGFTVNEAVVRISSLYAKDYLVDPKITLSVQGYATEFISVIGAVRNPGQMAIPVSGNMDLATAMATVGGLTETADADRILLVRASGTTSTFSMSSITYGKNGRVRLQADDRIIVNQSANLGKSVTVLGRVGRQGHIPFPIRGRLDLVSAIANAGGLTNLANPKKITINRKGEIIAVNYREITQRGEQPFILQPDDIIIVPERLF